MSLARLPAGLSHPAKLTSPAIGFPSGVKSSLVVNCCPVCASRLVDMHKEEAFGVSTSHLCPPATCAFSHYQPTFTVYMANLYASHHQGPIDLPPQRPVWETIPFSPSMHEDTTLSFRSGDSGYGHAQAECTRQNPPIDSTRLSRVLPQPLPSISPTRSILDRPLSLASPSSIPEMSRPACHSYSRSIVDDPVQRLGQPGFLLPPACKPDTHSTVCLFG